MFRKIFKITLTTWGKQFLFVFIAVLFSIFSYILWNNIVFWVKDYLQSQIRPLVWWDIVLSTNTSDIKDENILEKYKKDFEIAKTISINSTIFDFNNNPVLVELVYHDKNYPFYNKFKYDEINSSWNLIIKKDLYDKLGSNLSIFWKKYKVAWIISQSPLWNINIYSNQNIIYLPIEFFDKTINSKNSRIEYNYYLKLKYPNININLDDIKKDVSLKSFRITTINDRNQNISNITDRFYLFINFFNLCIFILTFFIVILSLETYFKKIKWTIWLLNIFWMKKIKIFYYNFFVLFIIFSSSLILAVILNFLVIYLLNLSYDFFSFKEISLFKWILVCLVFFVVWTFLPSYKIYKATTLSILKDESNFSNFEFKDYILYLLFIFFWFFLINLISWIELIFSFIYSFSFVFIISLFYVLIEKFLNTVYKNIIFNWVKLENFRPKQNFNFLNKIKISNFYLYEIIRSTIKPWNVSFLVIFSSLISFLSIFIFYVFSWSFLDYLKNITQKSNDTFILNIQQKDLEKVGKYFSNDEIYEIVTLKIKEINNKPLKDFLNTQNIPREFWREFFSTTKKLDNKIISWNNLNKWWVSVDREFASSLWLKIWDEVLYTVAGLEKKLVVQNFRESVRNWANPFFYFQLDENDFKNYPKNYIISYKSKNKQKNLELTLSKEIWNYLTFIKAWDIIDIVISIANKILLIVYLCLFYIFLFSFLSFLISILFLSTFKTNKIKLLNILWWNLNKLKFYFKIEFLYLVFISLIFSIFFGSLFLFIIFYFIKYFSLNLLVYFFWIFILFLLFFIFLIFMKLFNIKIW